MKKFTAAFLLVIIYLTASAQVADTIRRMSPPRRYQQAPPVDTTQQTVAGRRNSPAQEKKPYVIMISLDGFRYDFMDKYKAVHMLALSEGGVRAASMIPSYPSLTFPNHYTLVTGLYPAHHGLVNNDFYDPARKQFYSMNKKDVVKDGTWYGGTPLWVLAEQQKMLTASFYWVASEANIKGITPTYYYAYNTQISIRQRIQTVVEWLKLPEDKRPHFITFYFPDVDHEAHAHGPESAETEKSVHYVDSAVYQLTQAVKSTGLDVNFILVSDHGMTTVDYQHPIPYPTVDTAKFVTSGDGVIWELYARDPGYIPATYQKLKNEAVGYNVYLKSEMPANLHYGPADDKMNRVGDILLIPQWPKVFSNPGRRVNIGWHGYNPYLVTDMHATFLAWGPAFRQNLQIPAFENVNIFPIVTRILDLNVPFKIDGNGAVANSILRKF